MQLNRLIHKCLILFLGNKDENNINIEQYIPLLGKIIYFFFIILYFIAEGFIGVNKL